MAKKPAVCWLGLAFFEILLETGKFQKNFKYVSKRNLGVYGTHACPNIMSIIVLFISLNNPYGTHGRFWKGVIWLVD